MISIFTQICNKKELRDVLNAILRDKYSLSESMRNQSLNRLDLFMNHLNNNLQILVEHPYVDKVYRDSYYYYYASKNDVYHRDCIRLSFFTKEIEPNNFISIDDYQFLQEKYLAF